jgi:prophage tail gpP-like protein
MADTPSTTLDNVDVTAKVDNPTASTIYEADPPAGGDDLTLTIGNVNWVGWQRVQVTRSLDSVPANFDVVVTERYPNTTDIDIKPGDACQVKLGGDLVMTGWIDRYEVVLNAREHTVHISGRSKSQDLVDCAAFVGGQDPNAERYSVEGSVRSIVEKLAAAYNIHVTAQAGDGPYIPNFAINFGETPWEIIDRLTKIGAMVAYDMPDGSLMLATAGDEKMASGFVQGENVEQAEVNFSMDQRFSIYEAFTTPTPQLSLGGGGTSPPQWIARDEGVPRFRKRIIYSELPSPQGGSLVQQLVEWEKNRRFGRSQAVTVICDSWRDTSGNLWAPNHAAPVKLPAVKISDTWIIGQVTYTKDERGRHATVVLMPKGAFLPQPMATPGAYPTMASTTTQTTNNPTSTNPPDAPAGPAEPAPLQPTGNYSVGGAAGAGSLGKP